MERVVAVLVEVQRQVELRYELRLQGPRLGMLDPAHSGVLGHPAAEGGFPCLAKGQALAAAYTAQAQRRAAPADHGFDVA